MHAPPLRSTAVVFENVKRLKEVAVATKAVRLLRSCIVKNKDRQCTSFNVQPYVNGWVVFICQNIPRMVEKLSACISMSVQAVMVRTVE